MCTSIDSELRPNQAVLVGGCQYDHCEDHGGSFEIHIWHINNTATLAKLKCVQVWQIFVLQASKQSKRSSREHGMHSLLLVYVDG